MRIRPRNLRFLIALLVFFVCVGAAAIVANAQFKNLFGPGTDILGGPPAGNPTVEIRLTPANAKPGDEVTLSVSVTLPEGSYTYSTNRSFSGATRFKLEKITGLDSIDDEFQADRPPKIDVDPDLGRLEKYEKKVTWSRKWRVQSGANAGQVSITGKMSYQVCDANSCRPLREPIQVALAGRGTASVRGDLTAATGATTHPFAYENIPTRKIKGKERPGPIGWHFKLTPPAAKPGDEVTLSITARLQETYHIFALTQNPKNVGLPIRIGVDQLNGLKPVGSDFQPDRAPETKLVDDGKEQRFHHDEVTWSRKYQVLPSIEAGNYGIGGLIRYQVCDPRSCRSAKVAFALGVLASSTAALRSTDNGSDSAVVEKPDSRFVIRETGVESGGLLLYLFYAFCGGLILNVMPCVLPVIAIKVMSFVQQAGESRGRILALNGAYSAGVISVFLVLASLAVFAGLGWGGLFRSQEFNLVMACLVFAMGLSLLGIFEIPVPGLVGSAAGSQQKEGLLGAFLTGILATVLATPCSGPFLGTTLGWSVQQSVPVIYLVWGTMGLGMAFPYLMFGLFPSAIKWLPKPGNWMVRFKEFAGFVLLGTVVFILSFMNTAYTIPTLIMLLGIALGLWMIGNMYDITTPIRHKMTVRVTAIVLTAVICTFGYSLRSTGDTELPWKPFSEERLEAALADNKTVLIDFTADW